MCSRCKKHKPIDDFYHNTKSKDGYCCQCKKCNTEIAKERYHKKKNEINEKRKIWYQKNKKEINTRRRIRESSEDGKKKKSESNKKYREKNKESLKLHKHDYYERNKDKIKIKNHRRYIKNREKVLEQCKEYRKAHKAERQQYLAKNKSRILAQCAKRQRERKKEDPVFAFKVRVRNLFLMAFKKNNHIKNSTTKKLLGCEIQEAWRHLLKTYEINYGRPWDGEPYHIDHIVPLSIAKTKEDVVKLCHYTNLQMLTPEDNRIKSDRTDWESAYQKSN